MLAIFIKARITSSIKSEALYSYIKIEMKVEKIGKSTKRITKPFISLFYIFLHGVQTDKIFTKYMIIDQMNLKKINQTSTLNSSREIYFFFINVCPL